MNRWNELLAWIGRRIGKPPGWERFVRAFAAPSHFEGTQEVCLVRDGILFRTRLSLPLGWHVAFFGSYEPELREIARCVLRAGGVAIDAGANAGWHTLLFSAQAGPTGRVFAIEANPSVCEQLRLNVALNHASNVLVLPHAVGLDEGELRFSAPDAADASSGDGHVVAPGAESPADAIVRVRRIDSLVSELALDRVDLIKIDVEGFEWPVLQGAEATIARFRPHILFEHNVEYAAARAGGSAAVIGEFLARHGYDVFAIDRVAARRLAVGRWPRCADLWAIPRSTS